MPSEKLTALLDRDTVWAVYATAWLISDHPPRVGPRAIDAPWDYVLGAPGWAEDLNREAWIEGVKQRLGIITLDDDGEARVTRAELAKEPLPWTGPGWAVLDHGHVISSPGAKCPEEEGT